MPDKLKALVSILTPAGRGAIAVVAVEGPQAEQMVEQFFRPVRGGCLSARAMQQIVFGRWGLDPGEEVIAWRRASNHVEVHCHGGDSAVRRIVEELTASGATEEPWSQWISRQEPSAISAAAREALAHAATNRTAAVLLDQYHGALDTALRQIFGLLQSSTDDSHPTKPPDCISAAFSISQLLQRGPLGMHLTVPWKVVIAGPPNVGKSSLINALLGFQRAIVFDEPGTTRDLLTALTAFDGWPVELADTAGWRVSDDALEMAGIERAQQAAAAADCVLLVFDASQAWNRENQKLVELWPEAIVVHNKTDLGTPPANAAQGMFVSALKSTGLDSLAAAIISRLIAVELQAGDAVPFTRAHNAGLLAAQSALSCGDFSAAKSCLLALLVKN
ncbi:MAG TPA: GTPase [Pirellulales bacterium]|jgi:tRNA modification GTPase